MSFRFEFHCGRILLRGHLEFKNEKQNKLLQRKSFADFVATGSKLKICERFIISLVFLISPIAFYALEWFEYDKIETGKAGKMKRQVYHYNTQS